MRRARWCSSGPAGWRPLRAGAIACVLVLLAGCAQERIREDSQRALQAGEVEQAVRLLEAGLQEYPDSVLLRSGLTQARLEAQTRSLAEVSTLRAAGRLEDAAARLERARQLDPQSERVLALAEELRSDRRQAAALAEAEDLATKSNTAQALRVVEQALKDNPRHPGLLALQRRLELEARQAALQSSGLAETRPISLDFRDAALRTVLDLVSRNSGINFVLDRDIPQDTRVTVYLRQAKVEDAIDLIAGTNRLAKKVVDAQTIVLYPNTPEKRREYEEQIVRVFYLASADARGAAAFLRSMLNLREPFVDERSNMISIRDSQENVRLAERLVALYDAGEPEVLLEVEVLEVSSTRLTELGVKFPDSFSLLPLTADGGSDVTLGNVRGLNRDRLALGIGGVLVNLRREVGDFTTLANPRIRARNKEKAKILIGDKVPVISTTTGTGNFVSDSISYIEVGLKLDVEPTVYANDEVAIRIALEVSTLGTAIKTSAGALAYQIGTRNAQTALRLRDGETQLLAGLISRDDRTNSSRVPGLGDLPLLGRLFSSQLDSGQRTELVLAITPRVLRNVRRPSAAESELWVGTDVQPRLRRPVVAAVAAAPTASAAAMGLDPTPETGRLLAPPPMPAEPRQPAIALQWEGPAEAAVGDEIDLRVKITSRIALRGMPLDVSYDRARLQWLPPTEGDFFRQGQAATSFSETSQGDGGLGRVGVLRNQANGAVGEGTVVTLRFKALQSGPAVVRAEPVRPVAMQPSATPPAPLPAFAIQVR